MTPNDVRTARHLATRERILEAAWQLAREQGLNGFSLRELGARAGMRAPSLYVYFAGKSELYDAMYAQGWAAWHELRLAQNWPGHDRPRDRVRAWMRVFADFGTRDPVRFQLIAQRVVPGFEPSPESWQLALADWEAMAEEIRALGIEDADGAADLATAMVSGLVSQQIANDPGGNRWVSRVDEVAQLWCDRYGIGLAAPSTR